ncbi:hypothetical protein D9M70_266710 [compost metagenome]
MQIARKADSLAGDSILVREWRLYGAACADARSLQVASSFATTALRPAAVFVFCCAWYFSTRSVVAWK